MRFDKFTIKAQEAIAQAQEIAQKYNNQEIDVEHLLLSLIEQEDGVVPIILEKIGINVHDLAEKTRSEIEKLPGVYGGTQVYLSQRLNRVINKSFEEAEALKDEFVSTEHLFLSIISEKKDLGITKENVYKALKDIRGGAGGDRSKSRGKISSIGKVYKRFDSSCKER